MSIVVQKFGGTSVSSDESRSHCFVHIKQALEQGKKVVVVVSAMGRKGDPYATDTLLSLLPPSVSLSKRELDLFLSTGELISASVFSSALQKEGIPNVILTGGQAGIITNSHFTDARIVSLDPHRLKAELDHCNVVVVTGFQGVTTDGEVTTLGRGGSDTSATALGVALGAEVVDIFTDVEGIYTADPRIVKDAQPMESVTYTEICNLAHEGAKVIHPRAVEMAMQASIPLRVRSTFSRSPGTLVTNLSELQASRQPLREKLITGITQTPHVTQLTITNSASDPAFHASIFRSLKEQGLSLDFISVSQEHVRFTVPDARQDEAVAALKRLGHTPALLPHCAKVSVVGANMAGVPGVMARLIGALADEGISIYQSADSHTTIWVLVEQSRMNDAVCALHRAFLPHE